MIPLLKGQDEITTAAANKKSANADCTIIIDELRPAHGSVTFVVWFAYAPGVINLRTRRAGEP